MTAPPSHGRTPQKPSPNRGAAGLARQAETSFRMPLGYRTGWPDARSYPESGVRIRHNATHGHVDHGWGDDGVGIDPPPLPYEDWVPRPVSRGAVRAVSVVIQGFYGLPADPMLVASDDSRATVRLATGELRWYVDGSSLAFPLQGGIAVVDLHRVYPRGNRYMDALAVRSLEDLIETVNAEKVTSIDEDGTIHIYGEHDNSRGEALREPGSGIIVRASGIEGTSPWRLDVIETRLLTERQMLLEPTHVAPPTF